MISKPTEARQDELAGIKKRALLTDTALGKRKASLAMYRQMWDKAYNSPKNEFVHNLVKYERRIAKAQQDKDFSLTVSSGGGVCPKCNGLGRVAVDRHITGRIYQNNLVTCPACNGTGRTKVVEKTLLEIIKEALK